MPFSLHHGVTNRFFQTFDVQLISASGGAILGSYRAVRVAILKNDSPAGMFSFSQPSYTIREWGDDSLHSVTIRVIRTQGSLGKQ